MRVSKSDTICGVPAPAARQLMRAYFDQRPTEAACDVLGVDRRAARERLSAFETAGHIQRAEQDSGTGDE
jgi:predicted ArsR family transcriptional regulator